MPIEAPTSSPRPNSLVCRLLIRLDRRLRNRHRVFEYTRDPRCILRIKLGLLERNICLPDGSCAEVGDPMLDLHLWNEHIPRMPRRGATIGWAQKMHTAMVLSLQELAHFLAQRSDLEEIAILCVNTMFTSSRRTDQTVRLMRCYGFEPAGGANLQLQPEHRP